MRMGMLVSDNFFDVLGIQPALGRRFTPSEGQVPGRDAVVVLGHDFWNNALAGDGSILGSTVVLNGVDFIGRRRRTRELYRSGRSDAAGLLRAEHDGAAAQPCRSRQCESARGSNRPTDTRSREG